MKKRGPGRPRKIKTLEELQYEQNNPRKRRKKNGEPVLRIIKRKSSDIIGKKNVEIIDTEKAELQ